MSAFAIIRTGGKQYRVCEDQVIYIEKLDAEIAQEVTFTEVLLIEDNGSITIGTPLVENAVVKAEVIKQIRDKKVIVFKKKRRKNYRRKKGHRQYLTVVKITKISK